MPGRFNPEVTPWTKGMCDALDDPDVWKICCRKSAQVGWTDGVLLNYLGRRIHQSPCPMILMFSKEASAKKFAREKLVPMITVTPELAALVPVGKSRDRGNAWDHKDFAGGFLNLVGSNSPDSVKSTPAPVVAIEEPDDVNANVKGQGDTITLLMERTKTFTRRKIIYGGTPTVAGFSRVDEAYKGSDQRQYWVPCGDCGEMQTLRWEQVKWTEDPALNHEVFGSAVPSSARYCCAHCGSLWSDAEKNRAVRKGVWKASAAFHGVAGFAINELVSPFPGSKLALLVEKRLTAEHALRQGDDTLIRSFRNNTEGEVYSYASAVPSPEKLKDRADSYAELTVPWGGVILTAGVDVQHDRLAVIIRAWGRGEESWLVWWGEVYGRTMVCKWKEEGELDEEFSGAWFELDKLLMGEFTHASGVKLRIRAASIDSGDGQTQEAVYGYVRRRRGFMAIKGENWDPKRDVFSPPKLSVDTTGRHKPHPSGVKPFMVGAAVAKDLILGVDAQGGRIKLLGNGPGRMHWFADVRPDYFDQLTSEVKVPHKTIRGRMVWVCQAGHRNEGLDAEIYALHAARSLKLNLWREDRWAAEEAPIAATKPKATETEPEAGEGEQKAAETVPPAAKPQPKPSNLPRRGGWSANKW